jgi:[ribosomal protein S5]-alanine N-acetyltransferase
MNPFDPSALAPPIRIPVLHGSTVVLRPWSISDLSLVRQGSADAFVPSISSIPRRYSDDTGRAFIERQHRRAAEGDGISFVIAEASAPAVGIGSIGLWLHEIESGRASVGYWLLERFRGSRLATDALRAVVDFSFRGPGIPRLHLFVEPWNVASSRTAEAAGFIREATLRGWERIDGEQRDADCYALLAQEWQPVQET